MLCVFAWGSVWILDSIICTLKMVPKTWGWANGSLRIVEELADFLGLPNGPAANAKMLRGLEDGRSQHGELPNNDCVLS